MEVFKLMLLILGSVLSCMVSFFIVYDRLKKFLNSKMEEQNAFLVAWTSKQQLDIENSLEEREITIKALRAVLMRMIEQGANGTCSGMLKEIDEYLNAMAHEPRSYRKEV